MKNSKQTLSENSVILIISTVLVKIIGAVFKIPLATQTFLGDLGFGYYSVAHDIFMPFYVLAISGLPSAISHITAELLTKKHYGSIVKNFKFAKKIFWCSGFVFSIAVALLSIPLAIHSMDGRNTFFSIIAICPSIFLCFLISLYRGYFEGFNNMMPSAVSKILEAVFKLVLGLLFSYLVMIKTSNPALASASAMLAISIGTFISVLYLSCKFKKHNPISNLSLEENASNSEKITAKTLLLITLPFVLASLSSSIITLIDVFTVKTYIANASAEYVDFISNSYNITTGDISTVLYGVRSKAFTIYYLIPTITMAVGIGALPLLTQFFVNKDTVSLRQNINYTLKLTSIITFPSSFGLVILSTPIMKLLFSSSDALGSNMLFMFGISALFTGFAVPIMTILQAISEQKSVLKAIIIGLIIKIISNLLFVSFKEVHIYSSPLGTILCYGFITIYLIIVLYKRVGDADAINTYFKPIFAAITSCVAAYLITLFSDAKIVTLASILVAVILYFLLIFLTKTFSKDDLKSLILI